MKLSNFKYIKYAGLLLGILAVYLVDDARWKSLQDKQVSEKQIVIQTFWQMAAQTARTQGVQGFPLRDNEGGTLDKISQWNTMEAFLVKAEDATLLTAPVVGEDMLLQAKAFLSDDYQGRPIDCWSRAVKAARNGQSGVMIAQDYREEEAIIGFGLVRPADRDFDAVLILKMDVAEAVGTTLQWYHWLDLWLIIAINVGIAAVITYVHHYAEITEKKAESAPQREDLMEALDRFSGSGKEAADAKHMIRSLPDVVVIVDGNMTVRFVSLKACELFQIPETDLIGKDLNHAMPDPTKHQKQMLSFIEGNLTQRRTDVEYRGTRVNLLLKKVRSGNERFVIACARLDEAGDEQDTQQEFTKTWTPKF